ncbi:MAG: hypothetical protein ACE5O2_05725 [Armatimonadota bacterium]
MQPMTVVLILLPCQVVPQEHYPQEEDRYPWAAPGEQESLPTPESAYYYEPPTPPAEPGVYPYEGGQRVRNIDALPRSEYPRGPHEDDWGLTVAERTPAITLHMKTTFRAGTEGMERLCVIEAQGDKRDAWDAVVLLRDADGRELWRRPAPWLGPGGRFRAFWLPVRLQRGQQSQPEPQATQSQPSWYQPLDAPAVRPPPESGDVLELRIAGQMRAWCSAELGKWAPRVIVEARSIREPNAIDQGWGLMPASQLLASRNGTLEIVAATAEGLEQPLRVQARIAAAEGGAQTTSILDERMSASAHAQTRRWTVACDGLQPGIYDLTLTAHAGGEQAAKRAYRLHVLRALRVPTEFGARYTSLSYDGPVYVNYAESMPWDRVWRGRKQRDVVVEFPGKPFRFVLWRGCSYVPCWAFQNTWLAYEWLEAEPDYRGAVDCVEPIMDKFCRYSDAEIIESNPVRVVVHWRYALTDFHQNVIGDEWADEYFYLYPDAIGTRKLIAWIRGYAWHETQEFLLLNRAGNRPWQAVEPQAITFFSTDGREQRPYWPEPRFSVDGWDDIIARVNVRGQPDPFMTVPADYGTYLKVWAEPYANKPGLLNSYLHWPITHGIWTTWVDRDEHFQRPTHSNLVNIVTDEVEDADDHKTWVWLIGIAPPKRRLIEVSACWLRPGEVEVTDGPLASEGYDSSQRAYALKGRATRATILLRPANDAPVINPAFVIEGWDRGMEVRCSSDAASSVTVGRERNGTRAVVFAEGRFDEPTAFRLIPTSHD